MRALSNATSKNPLDSKEGASKFIKLTDRVLAKLDAIGIVAPPRFMKAMLFTNKVSRVLAKGPERSHLNIRLYVILGWVFNPKYHVQVLQSSHYEMIWFNSDTKVEGADSKACESIRVIRKRQPNHAVS